MPDSFAEYEYTQGDATFLFHIFYRRVNGEYEIDRVKLESVGVEIVGPGGLEVLDWVRYNQSVGWPKGMDYRQDQGATRNCHDAMLEACKRDWEARKTVDAERKAGI